MQEFLLEPNETDMVDIALSMPLEKKIDKAIGLLQLYRPTYIAYSGGKDSGCIKKLCEMAGVDAVPHYNVTTMDAPELVRFVKEQKDVKWNRPKISMMARLVERPSGPPVASMPWCCEEYKETGGKGHVRVVGVRVEESVRRRGLWKTVVPQNRGDHIICPICYWTTEDVWNFHEMENIDYCKLYDEGYSRLGCVGCPKARPKQQTVEFERWPGFETSWKRAIVRHYEKWKSVLTRDGKRRWFTKFANAEDYWQWWRTGGESVSKGDERCQGFSLFS